MSPTIRGMGSRKAKPKKPPSVVEGARNAAAQPDDDAGEQALRPSSTMTREVEAITAEELIASMVGTQPVPKPYSVPEPAPTEPRVVDDLAQTIEAPSAPRILIMDAAEMLIAHVGFGVVTEDEIAKAANVSIDVFHAHFADKLALLRGLNERFCAQAIAVTDDATRSGIWDHAAPGEMIEVAVRSIIDVVLSRAALVKAVLSSDDEELIEGFRRVGANVTARIMGVIEEMPTKDKPDERDVAFVFLLAVSLAHHAILVGPEWSGVAFEREELYDRGVRAVRGYLGGRSRPS